jgi:hypothetical protein
MRNTLPLEIRREIINEVIWTCLNRQKELSSVEAGSLWFLLRNIYLDQSPGKWENLHRIKAVQSIKKVYPTLRETISPWCDYKEEDD